MKLVTNDYGCGTSSSILDYEVKDVVIVSEKNYEHIFQCDDDLMFIGHDFLFYLWNTEEKIKKWIKYSEKNELWLWCFERIDAIVPQWRQKSHISISIASKFCKRILACDEDDCDKYGFDWLPQWASRKFYDKKHEKPKIQKILFSGQAGGPEYSERNLLLSQIKSDVNLSEKFVVTNTTRSFSWDEYVENLLNYEVILNPVGVLKSLNTRAYETLYSDRLLLQHTAGSYKRHQKMLEDCPSIAIFQSYEDLKKLLQGGYFLKPSGEDSYKKHSLYARMNSIGIDIK